MIRRPLAVVGLTVAVAVVGFTLTVALADEGQDLSLAHAIKAEAFERSRVMDHLAALTDVHGPRLTASPSFARSGEWAAERLKSFGLANVEVL